MAGGRPTREQASRALAAVAGLVAVPCLLAPRRVGRLTDLSPDAVRLIGVRDVGSGVSLVPAPGSRAPVVARLVFEIGDALVLRGRRRAFAALAVAGAAADVAALALGPADRGPD